MVVIRLARSGANKLPFYRVVVTDKRSRRDGRYIERVGHFNPIARGKDIPIKMNRERIEYWLAKGAQPSERVAQLFKSFIKQSECDLEKKPETHTEITPPEEKAAHATQAAEEKPTATQSVEATAQQPSSPTAEKGKEP